MGFFEADWLIDDKNKLHKAYACVEKLKDQQKLKRVVLEAPLKEVRAAAIGRLSDAAILAELAKTMPLPDVRRQTVVKVTDQSIVADVAETDENVSVRTAAIEKLTDQTALRRIAVNEKEKDLILLAIERMSEDDSDNQAALLHIAKNNADWKIRFKSALKLADQSQAQGVYSEVVKYDDLSERKLKKIVKRLTDQESLAYVAKMPTALSKGIFPLRKKALEKLHDRELLADVAENAADEFIRQEAAEKLSAQ